MRAALVASLVFAPLLLALAAPAAAAIAQDGNASYANPASGSVAACSGLATTAGDYQVAFVMTNSASATFNVPSNFSLVTGSNAFGIAAAIYVASSSLTAAPSFTASAGTAAATCAAFSGAGAVGPSAVGFNGNSATGNASAVTPPEANDLFVFLGANSAPTASVTTAPSGFSEVTPSGGATGSWFAQRDYLRLNPPTSAQQPAVVWNYSPTGNVALTGYLVLRPAVAPSSGSAAGNGATPTATGNGASSSAQGNG